MVIVLNLCVNAVLIIVFSALDLAALSCFAGDAYDISQIECVIQGKLVLAVCCFICCETGRNTQIAIIVLLCDDLIICYQIPDSL